MKEILKAIIGNSNIIRMKDYYYLFKNKSCKKCIEKNKQFENMYQGKRCFILGNGPSLSDIDLSILQDEITFSVNQLPRRSDFESLKTNIHMWVDRRFYDIDENRPEDMELLEVMRKVNTKNNKPIIFYRYEALNMINKYGLDKELDIYFFEHGFGRIEDVKKNHKVEFTKLVPNFSTIVHYAIQLAVYMGFKEIYLLGCECTGFLSIAQAKLMDAEKSEYTYEISENEKKRLERVWQQSSIEEELGVYSLLFKDYRYLKQYCDRYGVKLYNATNPTLLEGIERVNISEVLKSYKTSNL